MLYVVIDLAHAVEGNDIMHLSVEEIFFPFDIHGICLISKRHFLNIPLIELKDFPDGLCLRSFVSQFICPLAVEIFLIRFHGDLLTAIFF